MLLLVLKFLNFQQKFIGLVLLILFPFISLAQNDIKGKWLTEDEEGILEIYETNGQFFGKLVWLKTPNDKNGDLFTDTENPDQSKRNKPLVGLIILKNFTFQKGEWTGGTIYDPETGKTYRSTLKMEKGKLRVRGYWGVFYQTQSWTRQP